MTESRKGRAGRATAARRRVVVTGWGMVTSLGPDAATTFARAAAGHSGISELTAFPSDRLPCRVASQVDDAWLTTDWHGLDPARRGRTLAHWNVFTDVDGWVRMRLRSILRRRHKGRGRGRGNDHQRWPNSFFREAGLYFMQEGPQPPLPAPMRKTTDWRAGCGRSASPVQREGEAVTTRLSLPLSRVAAAVPGAP